MFNKVSATTASLQTANQTVDDLLSSGESEDESDVEGEKSEEEVVSHVLHSIIIKAGNPDKIIRSNKGVSRAACANRKIVKPTVGDRNPTSAKKRQVDRITHDDDDAKPSKRATMKAVAVG